MIEKPTRKPFLKLPTGERVMARRARAPRISRRQFIALAGAGAGAAALSGPLTGWGSTPAFAAAPPGIPPGIDPGIPVYTGLPNPAPPEPVPFDPERSMLEAIFDADVAAGGTSFWLDRTLVRTFLSPADSHLFTRGRALYMATH